MELIRQKASMYPTLDDIVLDFSEGMENSAATKLLLIGAYFQSSPAEVAVRLAEVTAVGAGIYATWTWEEKTGVPEERRTRAERLREGIASLGPVFVKMAQTLSTRPDIIGAEAADALKPLQDQMTAFPSNDAYEQIRRTLGWDGPVCPGDPTWTGSSDAEPIYAELSATPVAAASIGQVYKGKLHTGERVAVKVQRPGVLRRIALDLHISRMALIWLEESGLNGSEGLANIVDRVGQGIFQELDYTREADNADAFRRALRFLDFVVVPRHHASLTGRTVLTQEWIDGEPMKNLGDDDQLKMVQMGVECSSAQLFRTGLVHADPHEGNLLYTDTGKLALLDFGLVCRVNNAQQEAMAGCILNILNRDWMDLIDNLRIIEMLPETPQTWVDANGVPAAYSGEEGLGGQWAVSDDATFRKAFVDCMDGEDPSSKKLTNFTELVVDLTKLSTRWRFNLPPYMVFIIRSLTTLDFCAVRTGANMYELAAPTALFRAMAPKTERGRAQLRKMLLAKDGDVNWQKLIALTESAGGGAGDVEEGADPADIAANERVSTMTSKDIKTVDAAAPGRSAKNPAMDKHTRESVNRLVKELVGSSSGSALRRILVQATPESLVPPSAVRSTIVRATRSTFARTVSELSVREFFGLFVQAIRSFFAALSTAGKGKVDRESCDVFGEGTAEEYHCKVNLDKRRKKIAGLMLKSKLRGWGGFASAAALFALFGWAAITGTCIGMVQGIRRRIVEALGGTLNKPDASK
uniref:ABC1 atypical kinase-like domain-containing protein n=1 Tax=Micromonas pusilla TaxID=38833 RepID=A0A7S0KYW5_MICPS